MQLQRNGYIPISIHAPAKGATKTMQDNLKGAIISIHAPAKGATIPASRYHALQIFQSTLPRRERPAWFRLRSGLRYFNPRSREGSDHIPECLNSALEVFQSTLPRRERRKTVSAPSKPSDFNPRSREGSDYFLMICFWAITISIHAPAKGATSRSKVRTTADIFQSTLPRRERHDLLQFPSLSSVNFNPRSREGSDGPVEVTVGAGYNFNPRSREGSDRKRHRFPNLCCIFQSTLPRRERQQF